jgi:hypothetical protein
MNTRHDPHAADTALADLQAARALDRMLDQALNVEPSAEFLARVRTRIAAEPRPAASWSLRWVLVTSAAAAAVAVVAGISVLDRAPQTSEPLAPAVATANSGPAVAPRPAPPDITASLSMDRPVAQAPVRLSARSAVPVVRDPLARLVVVSQDDAQAFHAFATRVRGNRRAFTVTEESGDSLLARGIQIEPIVISPVVPQASEGE